MQTHSVRTHRSAEHFPREEYLAWKIARVATDPVAVPDDTAEMVVNRIIDNAAVAAASVTRRPVANARAQAVCHPHVPGATVFGVPGRLRHGGVHSDLRDVSHHRVDRPHHRAVDGERADSSAVRVRRSASATHH